MSRTSEDIVNSLAYHPATADTAPQFDRVRSAIIAVSVAWNEELPECREKSLALTALQEAMMWANASIALQTPLARDDQRATPQPPV